MYEAVRLTYSNSMQMASADRCTSSSKVVNMERYSLYSSGICVMGSDDFLLNIYFSNFNSFSVNWMYKEPFDVCVCVRETGRY